MKEMVPSLTRWPSGINHVIQSTTRMFVHLADAVTKSFNKVLLRTVDTDVVLAVAAAARINDRNYGWHFRHIPVHEIAKSLGPIKSITTNVSYLYRAWHSFIIWLKGKGDSMDHLDEL